MTDVPDEVRALAAERDERRRAKDFAAADALRDRIARARLLGDRRPGGAVPRTGRDRPRPHRLRPRDVESLLDDVADRRRERPLGRRGMARGRGARARRLPREPRGPRRAVRRRGRHRHGPGRLRRGGRGPARSSPGPAGARPATPGSSVHVVGSSSRSTDRSSRRATCSGRSRPRSRIRASGYAVRSASRPTTCASSTTATGPEVDAIEGYLMAFRRDVIRDVGLFDERFRWYRTADIECSFRIKDAGLRALRGRRAGQQARAPDVPLDPARRARPALQAQLLPVPRAVPRPVRPARRAPGRLAGLGGAGLAGRCPGPVRTAAVGVVAVARGSAPRAPPAWGSACVPSKYACRSGAVDHLGHDQDLRELLEEPAVACRAPRWPGRGPRSRARDVSSSMSAARSSESSGRRPGTGSRRPPRNPSLPNDTGPIFGLIPYSVTIAREISVARSRSFCAPVDTTLSNRISSAVRPPSRTASRSLQLGLGQQVPVLERSLHRHPERRRAARDDRDPVDGVGRGRGERDERVAHLVDRRPAPCPSRTSRGSCVPDPRPSGRSPPRARPS